MSTIIVLFIIVAVVLVVLGNLKKQGGGNSKERNPIKGKRILTMNEQPTFFRLREALPEHIVLAQVAFSAFMTAKGFPTRNLFNRKVADFVVLDKSLNIVAIVELDDSSHKGNEDKDSDRDALVAEAGYRVIRYKRTPDFAQVQKDFGIVTIAAPTPVEPVPVEEKTKLVSDAFIVQTESSDETKSP
ncbi:DUF2726 domain-containing protein [Acinetobacter ursingii]|uniref:DUF2726 domain-containing protein n=1 Tax=Acinetobacter ursingii TaxID=108980 RepID=UPI002446D9FC|nr:DUF2726 domain-containing protein [Acinetobacter ursingii]MDH2017609.1 DUF2726 domain-containing protein [Acinetobacter ursingii]MDH2070230.1 DUF2726 domain-containing protein [Acinetobacter ursingii]